MSQIGGLTPRPWLLLLSTLPWLARVLTSSDMGCEVSLWWIGVACIGSATRLMRPAEWSLLILAAGLWALNGRAVPPIPYVTSTLAYVAFMVLFMLRTDRAAAVRPSIQRLDIRLVVTLVSVGMTVGVWLGLRLLSLDTLAAFLIAFAAGVVAALLMVRYAPAIGLGRNLAPGRKNDPHA